MMMVDDLGGVGWGSKKRPFCDDVICEQPLIAVIVTKLRPKARHNCTEITFYFT